MRRSDTIIQKVKEYNKLLTEGANSTELLENFCKDMSPKEKDEFYNCLNEQKKEKEALDNTFRDVVNNGVKSIFRLAAMEKLRRKSRFQIVYIIVAMIILVWLAASINREDYVIALLMAAATLLVLAFAFDITIKLITYIFICISVKKMNYVHKMKKDYVDKYGEYEFPQ